MEFRMEKRDLKSGAYAMTQARDGLQRPSVLVLKMGTQKVSESMCWPLLITGR
jgi:hypothetical protein